MTQAGLLNAFGTQEVEWGGIAINASGTLFASVESMRNQVRIIGTGSLQGHVATFGKDVLKDARFTCFTDGTPDTLLICDSGHDRVVEASMHGEFMRAIDTGRFSFPTGIACCTRNDLMAVSRYLSRDVVVMRYASSAGIARLAGLKGPMGLRFTSDGSHVIVADSCKHRVSKFNATSGAFVAHVATRAMHGILYPSDVLQLEDGDVVIAQRGNVVYVGLDRACNVDITFDGRPFSPRVLAHSSTLCGVVVREVVSGRMRGKGDRLALLQDAWSRRSAWVSATAL